jgi:aspartyl-tRNA(Asn)/glutamyl-tRNA(Gln) amidotransferase subunit A
MTEDLLFMPAAKAAALIRSKKLSPVEYVDAVLNATERAQPRLNCLREVMIDRARADAKRAEAAVTRGDELGPLHGVPVSIKDLLDVEGVPTRHGSAIFADNPPAASDDITVARLRAAGAIIFAKAQSPEFGVKGLTDGPSFGIARNPWNLERTPGGSSGGGASAVAAGLGPLSLATDGAGSTRGPASCSGLVGLKARWAPCPTTRRATPSATTSSPARSPAPSPMPPSCTAC